MSLAQVIVIDLQEWIKPAVAIASAAALAGIISFLRSKTQSLAFTIMAGVWSYTLGKLGSVLWVFVKAPFILTKHIEDYQKDEVRKEKQREELIDAIHVTQRDVNELKAVNEASYYRAPEMKFRCDANGYTLRTSRLYLALVGATSPNEIRGRGWVSHLCPSQREEYEEWEKAVRSEERAGDFRGLELMSKGGESLGLFDVYLQPLKVYNGKVTVFYEGVIEPANDTACANVRSAGSRIGVKGVVCVCGICERHYVNTAHK